MENTIETIAEYMAKQENEHIEAKPKNLSLPIAIIILSLALMVVAASPIISGYNLSLAIIIITLITLIIGIVKLAKIKKGDKYIFVYSPTQEKLKNESIYVSMNDASKLRNCMASNNYSDLQDVKREFQSGCCLDIWGTKNSNFYVIQIREYIAYHYQPTSEVAIVKDKNADYVRHLLEAKV